MQWQLPEFMLNRVEHMELDCVAHSKKTGLCRAQQANWIVSCTASKLDCVAHSKQTAMQLPNHSWKTKELRSLETEDASLLKSGTAQ